MSQPDNSTTVVTIHQPHYFPWIGLVAKVACADVFVVLDNVQFEKHGWQNRTRYYDRGKLTFLTLPVRHRGVVKDSITIKDIQIADRRAGIKHWRTLKQIYGKKPGWNRISARLEHILTHEMTDLASAAMQTTELTFDVYNVRPKILLSSEMDVSGVKTERLIALTKASSGTRYLSGSGAHAYIEPDMFSAAGIELKFQKFSHPEYAQTKDAPFMPGAFALEWFLCDPDGAPVGLQRALMAFPDQPPRSIRSLAR